MKLSELGFTECELLEIEVLAEAEGVSALDYAATLLKEGLNRLAADESDHRPVVH